jgi:hypothetical protein
MNLDFTKIIYCYFFTQSDQKSIVDASVSIDSFDFVVNITSMVLQKD